MCNLFQLVEQNQADSRCLVQRYLEGIISQSRGFSGGSVGKESTCNAGDWGLIPGPGRSPQEENGSSLQYFALGNPMDRGAWRATVHAVAKELDMIERLNHHHKIIWMNNLHSGLCESSAEHLGTFMLPESHLGSRLVSAPYFVFLLFVSGSNSFLCAPCSSRALI